VIPHEDGQATFFPLQAANKDLLRASFLSSVYVPKSGSRVLLLAGQDVLSPSLDSAPFDPGPSEHQLIFGAQFFFMKFNPALF